MDVTLIEVPYDSGQAEVRMGRGPGRLLESGAARRVADAAGGTVGRQRLDCDAAFPTECTSAFELAGKIADTVRAARGHGAFPVVLAGNCISSLGTVAGLDDIARLGVVWFDAHGDLNTPDSSPAGFLDGMGAAILTGRGWQGPASGVPGYRWVPDAHLLHVGGRDLDAPERALLASSAIQAVDGDALARAGAAALKPPLAALADRVDAVYLHLDLDVHDADRVRFNPYAVPGGPAPEQVRAAVEAVFAAVPVAGVALTAYAPELDGDGTACATALALLETAVAGAARPSSSA
jgi:arginase